MYLMWVDPWPTFDSTWKRDSAYVLETNRHVTCELGCRCPVWSVSYTPPPPTTTHLVARPAPPDTIYGGRKGQTSHAGGFPFSGHMISLLCEELRCSARKILAEKRNLASVYMREIWLVYERNVQRRRGIRTRRREICSVEESKSSSLAGLQMSFLATVSTTSSISSSSACRSTHNTGPRQTRTTPATHTSIPGLLSNTTVRLNN